MQKITNFARFYGVFNKVKCPGDREDLKCDLVRQATGGRTESLREVTRREYDELCASLERTVPGSRLRRPVYDEQRRWRSSVLHQMQKMGIDTSDWGRVNAFCQDARMPVRCFANWILWSWRRCSVSCSASSVRVASGSPAALRVRWLKWFQ